MTMHGADSEQLDLLGGSLEKAADELQELLRQSAGEVALATLGTSLMTIWRGPRANDFANLWSSRHLLKLNGLERMLRDAAHTARTNAAEQRGASNSLGGVVGAGGATTKSYIAQPASGAVHQVDVHDAVANISNLLNDGVSHHEVDKIKDQLRELSEAERVGVVTQLSDGQLELLLNSVNDQYKWSKSKAEFWGLVVPFLTIDEKQRIFGKQWAAVTDVGTVPAVDPPENLLASLVNATDSGANGTGIAPDEIEIRALANGKYIVILPGVADLSSSLEAGEEVGRDIAESGASASRGDPRVVASSVVAGGIAGLYTANSELNRPSDIGSARDTRYAKDSLRNRENTSTTGENAYAFAVKEAMQNAGIPAGADVMIVGHSFGSMTATDLAGDETFNSKTSLADGSYHVNIDRVVAAGAYSPRSVSRVPDDVALLSFRSDNDRAVKAEAGAYFADSPHFGTNDSSTLSFDGGGEGHGHAVSNYTEFLEDSLGDRPPSYERSDEGLDIKTFSEAAGLDYGGDARVMRVKVKDAYSDPRLGGDQ